MVKWQTSICTMSKRYINGLRKIAWVSVSVWCLHVNVSMFPCLHAYISPSLHFSISQCIHASMSSYIHVSMFPCPHGCFHVSISLSPCLYVSMSPCFHVSTSPMSPCLHVLMSPCLLVHISSFPEVRKQKTEQTEYNTSVNGKQKQHSFVCLLQADTENIHLFSSSRQMINSNRWLLFQQTCPSMFKGNRNLASFCSPKKETLHSCCTMYSSVRHEKSFKISAVFPIYVFLSLWCWQGGGSDESRPVDDFVFYDWRYEADRSDVNQVGKIIDQCLILLIWSLQHCNIIF